MGQRQIGFLQGRIGDAAVVIALVSVRGSSPALAHYRGRPKAVLRILGFFLSLQCSITASNEALALFRSCSRCLEPSCQWKCVEFQDVEAN
jgi:hypothetical protein